MLLLLYPLLSVKPKLWPEFLLVQKQNRGETEYMIPSMNKMSVLDLDNIIWFPMDTNVPFPLRLMVPEDKLSSHY